MQKNGNNDLLLATALLAGFLAHIAHCIIRGIITASSGSWAPGNIVGIIMVLFLCTHFVLCWHVSTDYIDDKWRKAICSLAVSGFAIAAAYGTAYSIRINGLAIGIAAIIIFLAAIILTSVASGKSRYLRWEAAGIYTLEIEFVFLPTFFLLRTFGMR